MSNSKLEDSENDIQLEKKTKKQTTRSKNVLYNKEQLQLLNTIFQIIGINHNERTKLFYIDDFESNNDKKQEILNLIPNIKKYFATGTWRCFNRENNELWLNIIKTILKELNVSYNVCYIRNAFDSKIVKRALLFDA
jgi:hypothetical protein